MSDLSPLKLVEDGQSSSGSQVLDESSNVQRRRNDDPNRSNVSRYGTTTQQSRPRSPSEQSSDSDELKYGAQSVIQLFIPVSICMCIVIATLKITDEYKYSRESSIWYVMYTDQSVDSGKRFWQSVANALGLLVMIIVMTTLLIVLYKYRFYRLIRGWLIMSSLMLLFIFSLGYIAVWLKNFNVAVDWVTVGLGMWNFGVIGMICIHWKGPLIIQQAYLILISALMALVFIKMLPDWTVWTVLATVSIWDLVAVLSPKGPLRMLVETAQERNEPIFPALIYSSTILWEYTLMATNSIIPMADLQPSTLSQQVGDDTRPTEIQPDVAIIQPRRNSNEPNQANVRRQSRTSHSNKRDRMANTNSHNMNHSDVDVEPNLNASTQDEERGVKLGLGDFIFYSLLVGKVSSYDDWTITVSCYVAVLVGLCLTLSLLAVWRKALPALPISIAFGLGFYFLSSSFVTPFASELSFNQIFI